jgi:hypothetical protein
MNPNNRTLTPTERKVYLELSREFQKVLDAAPSFQMGIYQWNELQYELSSSEKIEA